MNAIQKITVKAADYTAFLRARAEENAAKKTKDAILAKWETESGLPLANASTAGEYIIVDGNGNELGKVSIAGRDSYVVKAGFVRKVS